jgi:hypothetical protein
MQAVENIRENFSVGKTTERSRTRVGTRIRNGPTFSRYCAVAIRVVAHAVVRANCTGDVNDATPSPPPALVSPVAAKASDRDRWGKSNREHL